MSINKSSQTIVDVLLNVAGTVDWLISSAEPVSCKAIPEDRLGQLRQLEMLGLITRSGGGTFRIQRERMKKVLNSALSSSRDDTRLLYVEAYREFIVTPSE
jgi:hypothetical protein